MTMAGRRAGRRDWRALLIGAVGVLVGLADVSRGGEPSERLPSRGLVNPFFAFENGLRDGKYPTPAARAALLAELGYDGVGATGIRDLGPLLEGLDAHGQDLFSIYTGVRIDGDGPRYDAALPEAVRLLRGRRAVLWVFVVSQRLRPSDPAGDARALPILREVADLAAQDGVGIVLYPHAGFWVETSEDSVRVARATGRPNVGGSLNLCHWLKVSGEEGMGAFLEKELDWIHLVSVNGADRGGTTWKELIRPFGAGTYDTSALLRSLNAAGYTGPVGLQCYGVEGPSRAHLLRSIEAWRSQSAAVERPWVSLLGAPGLDSWREETGEWVTGGGVTLDPADDRKLTVTPGFGVAQNGQRGRTAHLFSRVTHGDVEAHIEFLVARGSNSGVYFQGRYEIQILDSWGVKEPTHGDCGGIYQRWKGGKGFEGRPPGVNASRRAGEWQSFDVIFRAPRFDANGRKVRDAVFERVVHNGRVVHESQRVTGPTRAAAFGDERPLGPLMLQGDHGPVAFRNVRLRVLADTEAPTGAPAPARGD